MVTQGEGSTVREVMTLRDRRGRHVRRQGGDGDQPSFLFALRNTPAVVLHILCVPILPWHPKLIRSPQRATVTPGRGRVATRQPIGLVTNHISRGAVIILVEGPGTILMRLRFNITVLTCV